MEGVWLYALVSVLLVSLISFIGVATLAVNARRLQTALIYLISFAAGALFGDAFLHLLPEASEQGFSLGVASSVLAGIVVFFVLEKVIHWRHCHVPPSKEHVHPFAYMNLAGDAVHNFIDGMIIAASYVVSVPAGIATTLAVALHEIPQEIGDFGILVHGGFSRRKALLLNFTSALTAVLGAAIALLADRFVEGLTTFLIPLAVGGFIYIAGSDLIPELHREQRLAQSVLQIIAFIVGIAVMAALLLLE